MVALPSQDLALRMSNVGLGQEGGMLFSFLFDWTAYDLLGLTILNFLSSPMITSFPFIDSA
jgi:hypothetical protein